MPLLTSQSPLFSVVALRRVLQRTQIMGSLSGFICTLRTRPPNSESAASESFTEHAFPLGGYRAAPGGGPDIIPGLGQPFPSRRELPAPSARDLPDQGAPAEGAEGGLCNGNLSATVDAELGLHPHRGLRRRRMAPLLPPRFLGQRGDCCAPVGWVALRLRRVLRELS